MSSKIHNFLRMRQSYPRKKKFVSNGITFRMDVQVLREPKAVAHSLPKSKFRSKLIHSVFVYQPTDRSVECQHHPLRLCVGFNLDSFCNVPSSKLGFSRSQVPKAVAPFDQRECLSATSLHPIRISKVALSSVPCRN